MEHTPQDEMQKVLTFAELKDFVNKMDEEQLQQTVLCWVGDNDSATDINCIEALGEDTYYFPEHEYSCTKADYDKDIMTDVDDNIYPTFEDAISKEEHYIIPANRVYLHAFEF